MLSVADMKALLEGQKSAHLPEVVSGVTRLNVVNLQRTGVLCVVELDPISVAVHVAAFTKVAMMP